MKNPLPHNDDAERGVLSCCLQDPALIGECIERMGDDNWFYDLRRQRVFHVLQSLYASGKADFLIVRSTLKEQGVLDSIGGDTGLSQLQDYSPSTANLENYLEVIKQKAIHRKLIQACGESLEIARKDDLSEALPRVEKLILGVRPDNKEKHTAVELVDSALAMVEKLWESKGKISGLSTGLTDLDNATDGLHDGEMIIISGYPSTGKTSLAMNIAEHNYLNGIPVGVLSAEMSPKKLIERSIYSTAGVNRNEIRWGTASEMEFQKIQAASVRISKSPVHIENASGMTIGQAKAIARRMKSRNGIKLLVVDYLQILVGDEKESREMEVRSVGDGIKQIAMELDIPVTILSQLNDDGKVRESRAPNQTADSHWRLENDGEWMPKEQPIKLFIAKARDSEAGVCVPLLFRKTITRFENAAKIPQSLE